MSAYENVVGGKLKLKGKALNVKAGGLKKTKKKHKKHQHDDDNEDALSQHVDDQGGSAEEAAAPSEDVKSESNELDAKEKASHDDYMTPAERRYMEQREQIDLHKMAKEANKSHRDRIQDFNQYLANMSEHYDIPKVGPG